MTICGAPSAGALTDAAISGSASFLPQALSASDVAAGAGLPREHQDLVVVDDQGSITAPLARELRADGARELLTVPRRQQRPLLPEPATRRLNRVRQVLETVNDQLTVQFAPACTR